MNRISLTKLLDISIATGPTKVRAIRTTKQQLETGYDPRTDYWLPLRNRIVNIHRRNGSKASLKELLDSIADQKKAQNYSAAIDGYCRWWGRKEFDWFEPIHDFYRRGNTSVTVNPELGLVVNGEPHLIKVYFKSDPISKRKVDLACHLMHRTLSRQAPSDCRMAVLDVRKSKLFANTRPIAELDDAITGELAYIDAVWDGL